MTPEEVLGLSFPDWIDSKRSFVLQGGALGEGEAVVCAGRLFRPDDAEGGRHRNLVVWWADELYEVVLAGGSVDEALSKVQAVKATLGGQVALSLETRRRIFGPCPGSLTRQAIGGLWKAWSKPIRRAYMARREWALGRVVSRVGDDPTPAERLWAANYATGRLILRDYV